MKSKRRKIRILKFFGIRCKKKKVPLKDSIRPGRVKSYYPKEWKPPISRQLSTGEIEVVPHIDVLVNACNVFQNWSKEVKDEYKNYQGNQERREVSN